MTETKQIQVLEEMKLLRLIVAHIVIADLININYRPGRDKNGMSPIKFFDRLIDSCTGKKE